MKLIVVKYDESVDISVIAKGSDVSITDGTTVLTDGKVFGKLDLVDEDPFTGTTFSIVPV